MLFFFLTEKYKTAAVNCKEYVMQEVLHIFIIIIFDTGDDYSAEASMANHEIH